MALTYTVRDVKKLAAVNDGSDTSEGMAIVRADITVGAASADVGTTATASLVLSGSAILSSLGFGSAGSVLDILAGNVLGSASALRPLIPSLNTDNNTMYFWRHGSASNATEYVQAGSAQFVDGDRVRVILVGQIGK
jgi:hypothetical protein